VAEEVGFDKIRRKQAQLAELKNVFLDGARVAYASPPSGSQGAEQSISQTCPKVVELDISRNLFDQFSTVVDICSELKALQVLRVKYALCTRPDSGFHRANAVFCSGGTVS